MRAKKFIPVAAAIAATALVLTGCSAGGATTAGGSVKDAATKSSGTLVYATGEPDHLTPGRQTVAFTQVMSLFEPLTYVDDKNKITYDQAKSVTSDDATNWTITIRKGWKFQDGTPVTAQTYVDAWNYTAYAPNAFENSGELAEIAGYSDLNPTSGTPATKTMSGLKVVNATTFTVKLDHADSQFPLQLSQAQTGFYPMPESAYADMAAYDKKPVGDGPYKMSQAWVANKEFTVKKWAGYAGKAPKIANVTFRSYASQDTAYTDVLAGNADVLYLPTDKMTSAKSDFGDRLKSFDAPGIDYIAFPLGNPKYQNKKLRQAISMSIDRSAVNKAIYGGLYTNATALTPPAMSGTPLGICGKYCTFNPKAAKKLLAQAGGFTGEMDIVYPGGDGLDSLFQAYANQIRQNLGITDVVAKPSTDWASYYSTLVDGSVAGPHFGHWGALYQSQQNTLRSLFTKAGGCYLCTSFSDPAVDTLLTKADEASTQTAANAAYKEVQAKVLDEFPIVPTFFDKYSYVTSDRVKTLPASAGSPVVQDITLNK